MTDQSTEQQPVKRPIVKYLNGRNGTYEYATVIDIGDLNNLKTSSKEDVVKAINSLIDGNFSLSGKALGQIQDMQNKLQQAGMGGQNHFSMSLVNNLGWTAANILREAESHKGYSLKVEPGEKWTIYRLGNTNNRWRFYWLNQKPADGAPVLDVAFSEDSQKPNTPNVVEVPDGVSWGFLYLSNRKSDKIPPIMINKGDEPHGWTPSSEDHNDGLGLTTEIEMVIDENKKRIEELRSKLDERTLNLEKEYQEKLKELSDKYTREMADLETSVENAKATIEDTKTNLARVKQELGEADTLNYKKLEQKVDEVNNTITQKIEERDFDNLEATVRDHTTKISQNAKDIELRATKQSLDHTTGRVLAVENKVNVNSEGIAASLRKDELRENLQPLGVYPENLLRNTRHWDNWEQGTPTKVTVENDTYQHTSILRFDDNEGSVTGRVDGLEVGETYNLSVWAKSTNRETKLIARIGNTEHTLTHVESNNDRLSDSWGRYQFNFTAVDESTDIRFRPDRQRRGAQTRLAGAKVEWGTKFSGWREHLEDITDRVSNLETTIKVETGKIATRVSEVTETTGESISSLRQENTRQQNEIDANKQGITEAKNLVGTEVEKVTKVVTRNSTELTQLSDRIQASAQRMTEITKQVGDTAENIKTELRQEFAQLTIKPDQITSIVKEAISNNQINLNFDLDGRNYVRNSDFFLTTGNNNTLMHWTGVNRLWEVVDVAEKKKGVKATRRGLSSNQEAAMYSNYFPIATGDKVTIGFDVITENTDSEILARLELYNDNNIRQHFENLTIESMSGKYRAGQRSRLHRQIKIERRDATKARLVLLLTRNGTITFTDVSVQKGDITSYGWQNAPEDSRDIQAIMETVIDQNKREIALKANSTTVDTLTSSLEESKGQIRVNSDSITNAVTRISNTEKKLQEKAAEITVNAKAITQKVWQTDIDKTVRDKINELDIDDRNLLEGTSDEWGERLSQTGSNNLNIKEVSFSELGLKNGDKFTVSLKWKNLSRIPLTVKVEQFRGRAVSSTDSVARNQYDTEFSEVLTSTADTNRYDKVRIMIVGGHGNKTVQIKELKLQRGDKATGWFPNAKDIQSKIDQVSSEWKIEAGKITGTVQELSGNVSEYRQEAGQVTQTLTNLQGDINTTQNTVNRMNQTLYNERTGLITKVDAMPGRWEVAVNNLNSRLSGNEIVSRINVAGNTAKIQAKNIELTGAVTISHLDSNARDVINRKADSSDVTSRIENVTNKIDNMTIGERNLWVGSKATLDGGTDINNSDYSDYKYFDRTHSHEYSLPVKAGETYTLRYSVYNRNSSRNVSTEMLLDGRRQYREEYTIPQNEAKTITDTYKFTSDGRATFKINSDWAIAFAPPMLVKGDKIVSEYKEAPEDLERLINQKISTSDAESKISNAVRDAKTEIDQAIQGLSGTLGTINNSVTNVNNKVNNMTIGERNLWLNSKGLVASRGYLSESGKEQYAYFPSTANYKTTIPVKRDEAYTLRFSAYNSHRTYNYWITVTFTVGSNQQYRKRYSVPPRQEVTYVETHTFTASGDAEFKVASDSGIALNAPMLVRGNTIVSEYSEAPEDLIGLIDTKVSTAKREVNDALPDKITKGVEPIKNRVDTINQTVSGVNNTVSQMGTKVQSLDSTVSGIDTRVGTLNNSVTNVNNRVTNMTIGERNLWRRSKKMLEEGSNVSQSGYSDYKYFSSTKEFSYQLPVESGETYTLRWSVYNQYSSRHIETDITVNGRAEFNQRYNVPSRESKEVVETHTFTRSGTATFKIKSDFAMAFFPPMLVKGDKIVSKYTEAPEDIAEAVESTVNTQVTTAKESIKEDVKTRVQKTQQDLTKNIRDTKDEITRSVGTTIVNTIQQEADKKRNLWINSKQLIERGTKVTDRGYEDYATISGNSFSYEFDVRNGETYTFRISAYNSYNYNKSCTIMFKLDGRTQTTQRHTLYRQNSKTITERYTFSGTGRGKVEVTYEWGVAFNAPMLVRGSEIDPNWIAAPEDLEKAIESKIDAKEADKKIKTAVDNVESGINDKVTEKVKEKVDPITQKVTEVETEAGKAKTAADKAKEEAEKAKQKASEASESIATVDSKITNMDIGERNLWLDSKNYIQRGDAVWDSGYDNFRWFQNTQPYSYSISVESGEYYTLRFTAFNTNANYNRTITITISIGGSNQFSKTYTIGPKQSKLVVETARMGRTGSAEFKVVSNYGMAFNPPMLVKGNKIVSEYTEAPEDLEKTLGKKVDSKVDDAKTKIEDSVAGKVTQAVSGALDDVKNEISGDVTTKVNSAKDEIKRNIGTTVAEKIEEVQNKDINLWVNSKRHLEQGRQINDDGYSNYYYFSQHSTVAYELPVKSGETYTIRFSVYNEQDRYERNIRVKFYLNDTLQHNGANNRVWRRSTKNIVESYTFNGGGIGKIEITSDYGAAYTPPMLVKGSEISTEWKPSPQDIFDDINEAIEQKASDVEQKLSEQISSMREGFVSDQAFGAFREQYNSMLDKEAQQRKEIEKEVSKIDRENAILRVNVEKYGAFFEGLNRYVAIQDGLFIGHNSRSTGINITDNRIDFMDGGQSVAEITSQQMKINRGIFIEMLTIGEHVIRKDTEGVTSISWVG